MTKEKIIVSDTNILFDLFSISLLAHFFLLPFEITTTDFVIHEIQRYEQIHAINKYISADKLHVISFDYKEMYEITTLYDRNNTNTSITDCSVWYYAKKTGGRLLTGDNKLRRSAEKDNVIVSGILFVFDSLIEHGIIERTECANKLLELMSINKRLPQSVCNKRIKAWRDGIKLSINKENVSFSILQIEIYKKEKEEHLLFALEIPHNPSGFYI